MHRYAYTGPSGRGGRGEWRGGEGVGEGASAPQIINPALAPAHMELLSLYVVSVFV
jgi:hypothetical protein